MFIKQVSYTNSFPLGNMLYIYTHNPDILEDLTKLFFRKKNLMIELTTYINENILESVIIPKKYEINGI